MAEEPIYIVSIEMSSPNRIVNTHEIDTFNTTTRYLYDKPKRRQIGAIRARYKMIQYDACLRVFTLYVCKESVRTRIISTIEKADRDMKQVDPNLYARVLFFPLSRESIRESEMYDQLNSAIRTQVYGTLFERLQEVTKKSGIPRRSVDALLNMCDQLRDINVLDDSEISARIADIREKIKNKMFSPIMTELSAEIEKLESPFTYVEIDETPGPKNNKDVRTSTAFDGVEI